MLLKIFINNYITKSNHGKEKSLCTDVSAKNNDDERNLIEYDFVIRNLHCSQYLETSIAASQYWTPP